MRLRCSHKQQQRKKEIFDPTKIYINDISSFVKVIHF